MGPAKALETRRPESATAVGRASRQAALETRWQESATAAGRASRQAALEGSANFRRTGGIPQNNTPIHFQLTRLSHASNRKKQTKEGRRRRRRRHQVGK